MTMSGCQGSGDRPKFMTHHKGTPTVFDLQLNHVALLNLNNGCGGHQWCNPFSACQWHTAHLHHSTCLRLGLVPPSRPLINAVPSSHSSTVTRWSKCRSSKTRALIPPASSLAQTTQNTNTATMQDTTTPTKDPKTLTITIDVETQDHTTIRTCLDRFGMSSLRELVSKWASNIAVVMWHNGVEMFGCVEDMQFARIGHQAQL